MGAVVVVAGPGFIVGVVIAVAPFVVAVIRVVTVDARRCRCCASFVTWHSRATGFSSANAKDGGGGVLTLGPGDAPSWEGGVGEERWWCWEGRKRRQQVSGFGTTRAAEPEGRHMYTAKAK